MYLAANSSPVSPVRELFPPLWIPGVSSTITIRANREPIKTPLCLLAVKDGKFALKAKVPVKMD